VAKEVEEYKQEVRANLGFTPKPGADSHRLRKEERDMTHMDLRAMFGLSTYPHRKHHTNLNWHSIHLTMCTPMREWNHTMYTGCTIVACYLYAAISSSHHGILYHYICSVRQEGPKK